MALVSPVDSPMPSRVTSARHPAAIIAPRRTACSAWGDPSLQIRIFIANSSFAGMPGKQAVQQDRSADQRQRDERHPDPRTDNKLGERGADLRSDRGSGMHYQGSQNIHVSFKGMRQGAVARQNDNFEQIRADADMRRDPEQVNH